MTAAEFACSDHLHSNGHGSFSSTGKNRRTKKADPKTGARNFICLIGGAFLNIYDIVHAEQLFLTAKDISDILGADPQSIRRQARENASMLGFPVICVGNRVKIPRIPFLNYIGIEVRHTLYANDAAGPCQVIPSYVSAASESSYASAADLQGCQVENTRQQHTRTAVPRLKGANRR